MQVLLNLLSSSVFGALLCLTSAANAASHPYPALRVEYEYGYLAASSRFHGQASNDAQAIVIDADRQTSGVTRGIRASLALEIETRHFYLMPWFAVNYAQSSEISTVLHGTLGDYSMQSRGYYSAVSLGTEFQFWKRVFLVDVGSGLANAHATFRFPQFNTTTFESDSTQGLLFRVGAGLRAPLHFPVTFGFKAAFESAFQVTAIPIYRVTASLFAEFDVNELGG